jgi:hypothetical protein
MGLLDSLSNIEFKPTPMGLGLLNAGASMLQASNNQPRGASLGNVIGQGLQGFNTGIGQGVAYNQSQLENQQTDLLRQVQMQEAELKKKKLEQDIIAQEKLKTIDWSLPPKELASKLGQLGLTEKAFDLIKQASKGADAPSGWMYGPNGALVPVPVSIPGSPEITNMYDANLAKSQYLTPLQQRTEDRATRSESRSEVNQQRQIDAQDKAIAMEQWKLENPNAATNIKKIQDAESANKILQDTFKNYRNKLKEMDPLDIINPIKNTELQSLYQSATWPLRSETLMNTGVLNAGEIPMLHKALQDPTTAMAYFKGKDELLKQIESIINISNTNTNALKEALAPAPPPGVKNLNYYKKETNSKGWQLHIDANGNKAYVGPNGEIEEVK